MSLTGWPGDPPCWPAGDVIARLDAAAALLSGYGAANGRSVAVDPGALLTARARTRVLARRGTTSVGGRCRLLRAADGWVAVALARPSDLELVPALLAAWPAAGIGDGDGGADDVEAAWSRISACARQVPGAALVARAQLLGLPSARLPRRRPAPASPWTVRPLGPRRDRPVAGPLVVDCSAMWAGPLCAHLLGRAGARVVTVEDPARLDAARQGDPGLHASLHHGHGLVAVDLSSASGRERLRSLVGRADVVVEASRPRALAQLGLDPAAFCAARPGRTWISITGYGRSGRRSNWVAFGDDAAVGGGLVGRDAAGDPVFCGDAIADPVTGCYAAVGALGSMAAGGGHLVGCPMATAAAYAAAGAGCRAPHRVERDGDGWAVWHGDAAAPVAEPDRCGASSAARGRAGATR